jgi:hypothetical protein
MTPKTFAVGDFAATRTHLQLVRVLSRENGIMTVAHVRGRDELSLPGTVTDADLLTLDEFEVLLAKEAFRNAEPPDGASPRLIRVTRTVFLHLVVAPTEEILSRVPVFAGDKFVVEDHQEEDGLDWMRVAGSRLLPLPPDAWEVVAA